MAGKKDTFSFETSLKELEEIVNRMEQGDLSLEESLAAFEKGVNLTRQCQKALKDAEQKVSILVSNMGKDEAVPFEGESNEE